MKTFKYKAVLFDMDGVIIDSMPYHFIAWYEAFKTYGVTVNSIDIFLKEGEPWKKTMPFFLNRAGIKPTDKLMQEIFNFRQELFNKYFKLYFFDNVLEVIKFFKKQKCRLAIVSGTPYHHILEILPHNIQKQFDCIIGGDCVSEGKPNPAPYLKAAATLKINPKDCLVIENAPLGIESAKNAGMHCIAVATSLPHEYLYKADTIVAQIGEIVRLKFS